MELIFITTFTLANVSGERLIITRRSHWLTMSVCSESASDWYVIWLCAFLSFHNLTVYSSSAIIVPQKLYKPPVGALLMKSDCPSYFPINFRLPDDSGLSVRDAMIAHHAQRISGASEYVFPRDSCMDIKLHISVRTFIYLHDLAAVHLCSRI